MGTSGSAAFGENRSRPGGTDSTQVAVAPAALTFIEGRGQPEYLVSPEEPEANNRLPSPGSIQYFLELCGLSSGQERGEANTYAEIRWPNGLVASASHFFEDMGDRLLCLLAGVPNRPRSTRVSRAQPSLPSLIITEDDPLLRNAAQQELAWPSSVSITLEDLMPASEPLGAPSTPDQDFVIRLLEAATQGERASLENVMRDASAHNILGKLGIDPGNPSVGAIRARVEGLAGLALLSRQIAADVTRFLIDEKIPMEPALYLRRVNGRLRDEFGESDFIDQEESGGCIAASIANLMRAARRYGYDVTSPDTIRSAVEVYLGGGDPQQVERVMRAQEYLAYDPYAIRRLFPEAEVSDVPGIDSQGVFYGILRDLWHGRGGAVVKIGDHAISLVNLVVRCPRYGHPEVLVGVANSKPGWPVELQEVLPSRRSGDSRVPVHYGFIRVEDLAVILYGGTHITGVEGDARLSKRMDVWPISWRNVSKVEN